MFCVSVFGGEGREGGREGGRGWCVNKCGVETGNGEKGSIRVLSVHVFV